MHYLILETVALKPHLETAGELALRLRDEGHQVSFVWLGSGLPWVDGALPPIARLFGCSLERRVVRFIQLLEQEKIAIFPQINPDEERMIRALDWAEKFCGNTEDLKSYCLDSAKLGMGVASSLISFHRDSLYPVDKHIKRVRKCLAAAAIVYERALSMLRHLKPDVLITFNGRFATSKPIIAAAEAFGIKVLRHERGSTFDRYEIFDDALHNFTYIRRRIKNHWIVTSSDVREKNGHDFFRRRREGDGIGWYSFTDCQRRGVIPDRKKGLKRVVYFSSSDDEYAAVSDVFDPGPWPNQLAAVSSLINLSENICDFELIVRVHPHLMKKSFKERKRWEYFRGKNVSTIGPSEEVDSYALMDSADVIVTYGSTIGIESTYWGKPSILLGPSSYSDSNAVFSPNGDLELKLLLKFIDRLKPKSQELCLPYGNYYLTYGINFKYYKPMSLSEGLFLGNRLAWDSKFLNLLRQNGFGKIYQEIIKKWT